MNALRSPATATAMVGLAALVTCAHTDAGTARQAETGRPAIWSAS